MVVIPLFTQITNYVSFWRNSTSSHFAACALIATHLWVSRQTRQAFEAVHPCWGAREGSEISASQVPNDGKSVRATCCMLKNTTYDNICGIRSLLLALSLLMNIRSMTQRQSHKSQTTACFQKLDIHVLIRPLFYLTSQFSFTSPITWCCQGCFIGDRSWSQIWKQHLQRCKILTISESVIII